jgi:hypothetical protein
MENFKCLGPVLTNGICMHVEIKSRINLGNGCLRSLLDHLSPQLLCKNINIKIIMVFKYGVLRAEWKELVGKWGKLCNEKTHYWYFS